MAKYHLYFIDHQEQKAEPMRMILRQARAKFEEHPLRPKEMEIRQPSIPFGSTIYLESNEQIIAECAPIKNYLARQLGLMPEASALAVLYDTIIEANDNFKNDCDDFCLQFLGNLSLLGHDMHYQKCKYFIPKRNRYFRWLTKLLLASENGYLLGDTVTAADIITAESLNSQTLLGDGDYVEFPEVKKFIKRIYSLPNLQKAEAEGSKIPELKQLS